MRNEAASGTSRTPYLTVETTEELQRREGMPQELRRDNQKEGQRGARLGHGSTPKTKANVKGKTEINDGFEDEFIDTDGVDPFPIG